MSGKHEHQQRAGVSMRSGVASKQRAYDEVETLLVDEDGDDKRRASDTANLLRTDLRGDYFNISLLLFLYLLQGIPLGLAGSIPMILTNRHVSYAQQAIFSFVSWPFSVKLLWAPIVDSVYSQRFGRRKTWLVPTQYLIGIFMLILSMTIDWLLDSEGAGPNIYLLTAVFLLLNFLAATQDIAVDGWALTMLSRRNVTYASTCNTVGQTAGYFLGNVVFLALESADFCNKYLRSTPQPYGLVTLPGFFYFWGIVFLVTTTLITVFKKELNRRSGSEEPEMSILQTYSMLYRIFQLPSVRLFALVLLTCKIGFAITDSATGLKLIEAGVHKENLALLAIPLVPLQIVLPWLISKYTNGPQPLNVFIKAYPYRLFFGIVFALILWWTNLVKSSDGTFPNYYYVVIVIAYALHQVSLYSMFVALMAFHSRISDPAIGGTYMTLLNTVTNLGGNWPSTLALWLVDPLTFKKCYLNGASGSELCNDPNSIETCKLKGGECLTQIDGYYVEVVLCVILGLVWFKWGKLKLHQLQHKPLNSWKCT